VFAGYHDETRLLAARPRFVWREQADWVPFFASRPAGPKRTPREHPVATVGALISNPAGKVLLVLTHKWSHTYGIPGGKIEKGEDTVAALRREIREETGLAISDVEFVLVQDCIDSEEFYVPKSHFLLFNYKARTKSTKAKLNSEAQHYVRKLLNEAVRRKEMEPEVLNEEALNWGEGDFTRDQLRDVATPMAAPDASPEDIIAVKDLRKLLTTKFGRMDSVALLSRLNLLNPTKSVEGRSGFKSWDDVAQDVVDHEKARGKSVGFGYVKSNIMRNSYANDERRTRRSDEEGTRGG
jgi:ADP-ribose pyrophosphatase YjhB (NUDIX family)